MKVRIIAVWAMMHIAAGGCTVLRTSGEIRDAAGLGRLAGEKVVIVGTISDTPWQHMVAPRASHPHEAYFDMGSGQIVVYSKEPIECGGTVRIAGAVIMLEGSSKDPRRKETCTEYHVLADSWECLKQQDVR
jgi:hypothetical protein